ELLERPLYTVASQAPLWVPLRRVEASLGNVPGDPAEFVRATIKTETEMCAPAAPRWDALWQKARDAEALVAPERRPFYRAHVLAAIAINRASNRMLLQVVKAMQAVCDRRSAQ